MNSTSFSALPPAPLTPTFLGHFPKLANVPNPRTQAVHCHVYQLERKGCHFVAIVPNAFHPIRFKAHGGLQLGQKLLIKDSSDMNMVEVISTNGGFLIQDHRSNCAYILSRNGPVLFLYETSRLGGKCVVASIEGSGGMLRRKAKVFLPDSNQKIGTFERKWMSTSFLRGCRAYKIKSQPGYDVVMMIALQFCYEAIIDYINQ